MANARLNSTPAITCNGLFIPYL